MKQQELPERWKIKLSEYLVNQKSNYSSLSTHDFESNKKVVINSEDGSYAELKYPLIIEALEFNEVGIFTEHCGYYYFNLDSIKYKLKDDLINS